MKADLPRHSITQAGKLVRLTVWTVHGTSTMTFRTVAEARAHVPAMIAKSPAPMRAQTSLQKVTEAKEHDND